jgi:hypothetical protein
VTLKDPAPLYAPPTGIPRTKITRFLVDGFVHVAADSASDAISQRISFARILNAVQPLEFLLAAVTASIAPASAAFRTIILLVVLLPDAAPPVPAHLVRLPANDKFVRLSGCPAVRLSGCPAVSSRSRTIFILEQCGLHFH